MRITLALIGICFLVFILQILNPLFTALFSLTPNLALSGYYWQFLTYMFLHASPSHFAMNMFVLFIFGVTVERVLGLRKYLYLYLFSGIGSGIFYLILTGPSDIIMLGASGAVFGVLTAYGFLFPKNWIIMFPGIPMPAALLVIFFAVLQFFYGVSGAQPGIANFGHLGGILFGAIFMIWWRFGRKKPAGFEFTWE